MLHERLVQSMGWHPIEPANAPSIQMPAFGPCAGIELGQRAHDEIAYLVRPDCVWSTHGSHSRRYGRLRSTTAYTAAASDSSNCRISIPAPTCTMELHYAPPGFCGLRDFEIAGVSGVSGCMRVGHQALPSGSRTPSPDRRRTGTGSGPRREIIPYFTSASKLMISFQ